MSFQIVDLLRAIGPTASLVLVAWICLGLLERRYRAEFERYRALAHAYREQQEEGARQLSLQREIRLCARRCDYMRQSSHAGTLSAILLVLTLVLAAADVIVPGHPLLAIAAAVSASVGLLLVAASAIVGLVENTIIRIAFDEELADLPESQPGAVPPRP